MWLLWLMWLVWLFFVVVVVVERLIILKESCERQKPSTLCGKCVNKMTLFPRKNDILPNWVVGFLFENNTFVKKKNQEFVENFASETKNLDIFEDFAFFIFHLLSCFLVLF